MLLELAVIGLLGYAAIQKPDQFQSTLNRTAEQISKKAERNDQKGIISEAQYGVYTGTINANSEQEVIAFIKRKYI